ncbi:hypothetical protein [Streptomyces tsukubensis]|uniref:Secreted protein n=1 Tax=Streptomyces tsukubensis TaxID=83656 RepID=A0A1V4AE28_9ACTN|nr:hypothetical protein [Streptomyces tsukubensis]OON82270.1 hypothetical protein B1H18_04355 [Streptomyces tsukubensis]QFR92760.1 hypothetical protein GBW32_06375 [Streptomyces tsukubensis]
MQPSAVPELAHTRTRPIHWLATAAALAAAVAGASFIQPGAAAASKGPEPSAGSGHHRAAAPAASTADYPLRCAPGAGGDREEPVVAQHAAADLDGDGNPETVAVVHCPAGSGTPPDGVYVLTRASATDATARVVATLVDPKDRLTVDDFGVHSATVAATLLGYSSLDVPRCCPDTHKKAQWRWRDNTFVRSVPAGTRAM